MSLFRSDSVSHYNVIMPREDAWEILNKLGNMDTVHIVPNKDPNASRPFYAHVKFCSDALSTIHNIEDKLVEKLQYQPQTEYTKEFLNEVFSSHEKQREDSHCSELAVLQAKHDEVMRMWAKYQDLHSKSLESLKMISQSREQLAVMRAGRHNFGSGFFNQLLESPQQGFKMNYKVGVVRNGDLQIFRKAVIRITRGNSFPVFTAFDEIFDELLSGEQQKNVVFVFYVGKIGSSVDLKLEKLMENYRYGKQCASVDNIEKEEKKYQQICRQAETIYQLTQRSQKEYLFAIGFQADSDFRTSRLECLKIYFIREQELYNQMNNFETITNFYRGGMYVINENIEAVNRQLREIQMKSGNSQSELFLNRNQKLPTSFQLNDFTAPSQEIVSTYGVPCYQQANPAFFTIITFPFLFGVMFGDIAHGAILLLFAIYLLWQDKEKNKNSVIRPLISYRYMFLLMGFFATYCGFIYNDYLSIRLNMLGSCYDLTKGHPEQAIRRSDKQCTYLFGLDPIWGIASNSLNYVNSLKMKISVIIAVIHMLLGVCLKASNSLFFGRKVDFFFQFVPQFLFLGLLFGYMDFLIVFKWLRYEQLYDSSAPSIITTMINLPLKLGSTQDCCGGQPMWGEYGDTSQDRIQLTILFVSVLCIPMMLFPKVLIRIHCRKRPASYIEGEYEELNEELENEGEAANDQSDPKDEQMEQTSQIVVHQIIETIEYVLGCISNTASYLRLWALSLAHSQLAEVFFSKTVESGIAQGFSGIPQMIVGFPMLAGFTFGVLMCMDCMQCFLHTLRLHWVEFQNKFYQGNGFEYKPVSFSKTVNEVIMKK